MPSSFYWDSLVDFVNDDAWVMVEPGNKLVCEISGFMRYRRFPRVNVVGLSRWVDSKMETEPLSDGTSIDRSSGSTRSASSVGIDCGGIDPSVEDINRTMHPIGEHDKQCIASAVVIERHPIKAFRWLRVNDCSCWTGKIWPSEFISDRDGPSPVADKDPARSQLTTSDVDQFTNVKCVPEEHQKTVPFSWLKDCPRVVMCWRNVGVECPHL